MTLTVKINERPADIQTIGKLVPGTIFALGGGRAFMRTNFAHQGKVMNVELSTGQCNWLPPEAVVEMVYEASVELTPKYAVVKATKK